MPKKKTNKEITISISKANITKIILAVLFLIVGAIGGALSYFIICKNDKFEVVGEKNINLIVGQEYNETGAIAISFGKDVSSKIIVSGSVDSNKAGKYFIVYTTSDIKFSKVKRVRVVVVSEAINE